MESQQNLKYDIVYKIIIIGESGVGKTCLLLRYVEDNFLDNYLVTIGKKNNNQIGIDFKLKTIDLHGQLIKLQIWDTAGQERFRTLTKTYYHGSHGIILAYDVTNRLSFRNIRNWIKQIEQNTQKNVTKLLIGNKCDLDFKRKVSFKEGKKLANEFRINFIETSAKENLNVDEAFNILAKEIIKNSFKLSMSKRISEISIKLLLFFLIYYDFQLLLNLSIKFSIIFFFKIFFLPLISDF